MAMRHPLANPVGWCLRKSCIFLVVLLDITTRLSILPRRLCVVRLLKLCVTWVPVNALRIFCGVRLVTARVTRRVCLSRRFVGIILRISLTWQVLLVLNLLVASRKCTVPF